MLARLTSNSIEILKIGTNVINMKLRQDKVIKFIDDQTNHQPIQWPDAALSRPLVFGKETRD
jgi:hypothetical protein